jgi:hypothetical protein
LTLCLPLKWLEGILFTGSTLALVVGLTYFLREVHLANLSVRLEIQPGTAPDRPASQDRVRIADN